MTTNTTDIAVSNASDVIYNTDAKTLNTIVNDALAAAPMEGVSANQRADLQTVDLVAADDVLTVALTFALVHTESASCNEGETESAE